MRGFLGIVAVTLLPPWAIAPIAAGDVPPRASADWWSFRPIAASAPPAINGLDAGWSRNPIDAFILARLQGRGLRISPPANRATLIRRVTIDLTGLPPTPDEVDAFVADQDPMAYEKVVDRLLASPHYGERWGRHWLDVVRFGESEGYETNMPRPAAWPYRDYIIRAFNRDTPFPRFVLEQLAGDTVVADVEGAFHPGADWLTRAATGFLVGGTHDIVGNQTVEGMLQQRADDLDDMITATGTTFLGLTIQCARCHDHKFDPIDQKDYYALQAVFAGVKHGERELAVPDAESRMRERAAISTELGQIETAIDRFEPLAQPDSDQHTRPKVDPRRNVERFPPVKSRMIRMTIMATNDQTEPCIDEIEVFTASESDRSSEAPRNIALAGAGGKASATSEFVGSDLHKIAHLNDGRLGNGRSWISRTPGKGQLTIAWDKPEMIDRIVWGRDRQEVYHDRLATDYLLESALEPGKWQLIASSRDRIGDGRLPSPQLGVGAREEGAVKLLESRLQAVRGPARAGTPTESSAGARSPLPPRREGARGEGAVKLLESRLQAVRGPAKAGTPTESSTGARSPSPQRGKGARRAGEGAGANNRFLTPFVGLGSVGRASVPAERATLLARQAKLRERLADLSVTIKVYAGQFDQPGPTHILLRGDPTKKKAEVRPASVAVIKPAFDLDPKLPEAQRRRALARWIADPANPLPARVMVNRLWHYHFGRGIVATTSDFGFSGSPPSHPELLDWLAAMYRASGWQLKPIHRLIVTSAVYRQSSQLNPAAQNIDRENRLLGRMNPRRLEAESIRDAILASSGELDRRMGGPGYNIWEKNTNYVAVYKPKAELAPDTFRRMVYQFKPRSQADLTFGAFDCPDAALVAPRRNVSTTALQALNLLNSRFVVQQAAYFAGRLAAEAGPDPARQAERGFFIAFGRAATDSERIAATALIRSHGTAAFCRALYNANEFVYVP
jgi:hypothetical protein